MKRFAPTLALALVLIGTTTASPARAEDDEKKPAEAEAAPGAEEQYPPFSTRFKVMTAGILVTGAAWGISYAAARAWPENACHITVAGSFDAHQKPCVSGPPGAAQLGIPVAGPWIALGKSGCASDEPNCSGAKIGLRAFAYVVDGLVQAAGMALVIQSIVMKTAPVDSGKKASALALRYGGVEVTPLPVVSPTMSGLGLVGTF